MPVTVRIDPTANSQQAAIIPNATLKNDGVMTSAMVAALGFAAQDVNIFASPDGDDANPGTAALPVRTLGGAYARVPIAWRKGATIRMAPGTYESNSAGQAAPAFSGIPIGPDASPLVVIGDVTNELGDRTTTVGSDVGGVGVVFTDGTLAMTPGAYEGAFLTVLSGANAGQRFTIIENDATSLFINAPTTNPIAIGDGFRVERPSVNINVDNFILGGGGQFFGFKNLKFTVSSALVLPGAYGRVVVEGVEVDLGNTASFTVGRHSQFFPVSSPLPWINRSADNPFSFDAGAASLYIHDGLANFEPQSQMVEGWVVARNTLWLFTDGCAMVDMTWDAKQTSIAAFGASINMLSDATIPGRFIENNGNEPLGILNMTDGSVASMIDAHDFSKSSGDAIRVLGSRAKLGLVTSLGDPNTGYGIVGDQMSEVVIDAADGSGLTAVTGTLGDTRIGHTSVPTVKTYGQLRTPDGSGVAGYTDDYLDRIAPEA